MSKMVRLLACLPMALLSGLLVFVFVLPEEDQLFNRRRPCLYLLPQGYIGQIRVEYRVPGEPPLRVQNGRYVLRISPEGRLRTSTAMGDGWASDEFFYSTKAGRQRLPDNGAGQMIWDSGYEPNGGNERFFIGTAKQKRKAETIRQGAVKDGPLNPQTLLPQRASHFKAPRPH